VSSRRFLTLGIVLLLLLLGSRVSAAQPTSTIKVNPGVAGPVTINTAVAGQEPTPVAVSGGTYNLSLKKNGGLYTITARLSTSLPPGTTLSINLSSPGSGAQSNGSVQLTTSPQPVVINLPNKKLTANGNALSYSFTATAAAGVLATQSVSVILELAP
jgi:hypothetical protein